MEKLLAVLLAGILLFGCAQTGENGAVSGNKTGEIGMKLENSSSTGGIGAKSGDIVEVDYVGTFDNGTLFDTSLEAEAKKAGLELRPAYEPLKFTVGMGQMIKGFDSGVVGMKEGESKNVRILAKDAYGEYRQELVGEIGIDKVPEGVKVGTELSSGEGMRGIVTRVGSENVTIDFNHPMAGKALNFKITMRKIART
jgi:peptidylprolyl isomerase